MVYLRKLTPVLSGTLEYTTGICQEVKYLGEPHSTAECSHLET